MPNWLDTLIDWGKTGIDAGKKHLWDPIVNSLKGTMGEDGLLNPKNLVELSMVYILAEQLADGDNKKTAENMRKDFQRFLPEYVKSKVDAFNVEQTALRDAEYLLNNGKKIERDAAGNVKRDAEGNTVFTDVGGGRREFYNREMYGLSTKWETDEHGNILFDEQGNQKVLRTGEPGQLEIENLAQIEAGRKRRMAGAATSADVYAPETGTVQTVGRGVRAFEDAAAPYLDPTQAQQAASFQALLASQDPTKLSGSEMANIERGLGRMGIGVGRTSNMDVIGASHQFGDALAQKQQRLAQALAQTAPVASSFKSGVNPGLIEGQQGMAGTQVQNVPGQMTFGTTTPYEALQQTAATTRSSNQGTSGGQAVYDQLFPPKPRG
tara:strand:- start:780 stop:1919 length:1140 start_codon:yes stop_codon:yes gene_type:complete